MSQIKVLFAIPIDVIVVVGTLPTLLSLIVLDPVTTELNFVWGLS